MTVNCKYDGPFRYALVSTIASLNTYTPQWTLIQVPLFTYASGLEMKLLLSKDILFRAVLSSLNSYI